jgi:hypothetical protein
MDKWTHIFALPSLTLRTTIECEYAAIVSIDDDRVKDIATEHPTLLRFLSKFSHQFGQMIRPSLMVMRTDTPNSYYTVEGVTGFRDILSMSVVPYARAKCLRFDRSSHLIHTNVFQFYPWTLDREYEDLMLSNAAEIHIHELDRFNGQCFPEQSPGIVETRDVDLPLANALLRRWLVRFSDHETEWRDRALFRSLNMANEAGKIPATSASSFYDVGRSIALWVSAYEILAHPGGAGRSNFARVADLIDSVAWRNRKLADAIYVLPGKKAEQKPLATWICKHIYDLRNDFLHGNDVQPTALVLNGKPIIDLAACLYRLALAAFLDLDDPAEEARLRPILRGQLPFYPYQSVFEEGLMARSNSPLTHWSGRPRVPV